MVFLARHDELVVDLGRDGAVDRFPEARPAGPAVVLGARFEQRQLARGADEGPLALFVVERARERPLGALLAQDVELLGGQHFPPLGFGLGDRADGGRRPLRRMQIGQARGTGHGAGRANQEIASVHVSTRPAARRVPTRPLRGQRTQGRRPQDSRRLVPRSGMRLRRTQFASGAVPYQAFSRTMPSITLATSSHLSVIDSRSWYTSFSLMIWRTSDPSRNSLARPERNTKSASLSSR